MVRKFLEDIFRRKLDVLHSARVVHTLYRQQKQGKYCDLKVLVEDKQYFVHRCVLASASAQLDAQINGLDTVQLVGVTNYGFERLLEILYSGKMSKVATVDSVHFHQIVSAADALNAECVIEYCARERGDLMKLVLDQPDTSAEETRDVSMSSSTITQTAITESLAVDSPTPGPDTGPSGSESNNDSITKISSGEVFASSSKASSKIEQKPLKSEERNVEQLNWEVKVKQEPQENYVNRSEFEERVAAQVEVSDGTNVIETQQESQFPANQTSAIPHPQVMMSSTGEVVSALHGLESTGDEEEMDVRESPESLKVGGNQEQIKTSRISSMMSGASAIHRGLKCAICKRMFSTTHHLKIHMKKHTGGMKPFRCETCGMRFSFQLTLMNHMKLHEVNKIVCQICNKDFKLQKNLQAHLQHAHNTEMQYAIGQSSYSFPHSFPQTSMEGSSRRKSAPAKRVATDQQQIQYLEQAESSGIQNFPIELNTNSELEELKIAAEQTQAGGDGKYPCPLCGKGFSRRWNLKCHVLTHAENRQPRRPLKMKSNVVSKKDPNQPYNLLFVCPVCGKSFQSLSNLRKHSTVVHPNSQAVEAVYCPQVAPFVKPTAPKVIRPNQQQMTTFPKEQFAKEKSPLVCWCDICGRGFRRVRNLRNHMETHTGGGYECHICGRTFAQKDGLNGHLWIHGGVGGSKTTPSTP